MNISDILIGVNPSALDYPLIHTNWLLDYKINGTKSYVYKDKDILHELYRSPISANDEDVQLDAFNYIAAEHPDYLGTYLSKNYGFRDLVNLPNIRSISDLVADTNILNRIKESEFASSFFALADVIDAFATTEGLKNASLDNDIMTLLESSDSFKTKVASNPDVQTISATSSSVSVQNAYVISMYAGMYAYRSGYNTFRYRGSATKIIHGSTTNTTILSEVLGSSDTVYAADLAINNFVKNLQVNQPGGEGNGKVENKITFIQLDTVV